MAKNENFLCYVFEKDILSQGRPSQREGMVPLISSKSYIVTLLKTERDNLCMLSQRAYHNGTLLYNPASKRKTVLEVGDGDKRTSLPRHSADCYCKEFYSTSPWVCNVDSN